MGERRSSVFSLACVQQQNDGARWVGTGIGRFGFANHECTDPHGNSGLAHRNGTGAGYLASVGMVSLCAPSSPSLLSL